MPILAMGIGLPFGGSAAIAPLFGAGSAGSNLLGYNEPSGLAVDFMAATPDLLIRDPASTLNYSGPPFTTDGGKFTNARASIATRVNASGFIETVANNVTRIEHVLGTGVRQGVLIEESRTNIALWCSDLTNAVWVKTSTTAALNAIGPDGLANSASTLTATGANGTCLQTVTAVAANRGQSAYIKRVTGTGNIDMTMDGGTTWTPVTATGTWSRVTIPNQNITNPVFGFRMAVSGDAIVVYGVQNEFIQTTAVAISSLIPTTTVAVTRIGELATMAVSLFTYTDGGPGTMILEFITLDSSTANAGLANIRLSTPTVLGLYISATTPGYVLQTGSVGAAGATMGAAIGMGPSAKIGMAWNTNDFIGCRDGILTAADTSGAVPTGLTALELKGSGHSVAAKLIIFRKFTFIPRRLTNAELQARTT